jgi:hypothetical protein
LMLSPPNPERDDKVDYERLGYRYMPPIERNAARTRKEFNERIWGQLRGGNGDAPEENSGHASCHPCIKALRSCQPFKCCLQGAKPRRRKSKKSKKCVRADIQDTSTVPSSPSTQHVNEARPARQYGSLRASPLRLYMVPQPALPPSPPPTIPTGPSGVSEAATTEALDTEAAPDEAPVVLPTRPMSEQRGQSSMWDAPVQCKVIEQPLWRFCSGLVPGITVTPPSDVVSDPEDEGRSVPKKKNGFLGVWRR